MSKVLFTTYDGVQISKQSDILFGLDKDHNRINLPYANIAEIHKENIKWFSSAKSIDYYLSEEYQQKFIDYVYSFYGEVNIYHHFFNPILTRKDIERTVIKLELISPFGDYDSISREIVRDYILLQRGNEDVEWKGLINKKWSGNIKIDDATEKMLNLVLHICNCTGKTKLQVIDKMKNIEESLKGKYVRKQTYEKHYKRLLYDWASKNSKDYNTDLKF